MAFEIVAERESETVRMKRNSSLMVIAKARVWASEGWSVTIVVGDEDTTTLVDEYAPSFMRQPAGSSPGIKSLAFRPH